MVMTARLILTLEHKWPEHEMLAATKTHGRAYVDTRPLLAQVYSVGFRQPDTFKNKISSCVGS